MSDRTPELAVLAVLVLLVGGSLLLGGSSSGSGSDAEAVSPERLARVERRVEELRGLRFERPVSVEVMTPAEVRAFGVRESRAASSREQDAADAELMKLLGLIGPAVDLDAVTASIYGEQVAGFYDPRSKRLALVSGVGIDDVTLAHELTHALEDQHFGLGDLGEGDDDAASAEQGLVEGSATVLMTRYLQRYPDALTFGDAVGQLWGATGATPLPPYVMRSLLFSYDAGERFVDRLIAAGGGWRLVNEALRSRPPTSTAELYDADRWRSRVRPQQVTQAASAVPGAGWRRLLGSTFGEFDLRELLRNGVGERAAGQLATAWEGGRYMLWRRGPLPADDCAAPCTARDAFALRLRFDSPAAAGAVAAALGAWLQRARRASWDGGADWSLPADAAATVGARGAQVTLTLAPTRALARRLAG